jgi:hypothetical protein
MPEASPHDAADARELPPRSGSNVIVSNLFGDNRADRYVSPEAVAPDDTVGHDRATLIAQSLFRRLTRCRQIILWVVQYQNIAVALPLCLCHVVLQKNVFSFVYGTQGHTPMTPPH